MATNGNRRTRRKLPEAAVAHLPMTPSTHSAAEMTAEEAAPALEQALVEADIAAAPLVTPAEIVPPNLSIPATPSPNPDVDPAPAEPTAPVSAVSTEDTIMDATATINAAGDKSQAMFADMNSRAKGAMEKSAQFFAELTEFSRGNLEAMMESSRIAARGFESMGQDAASYAKTSFEGATAAMRDMAAVKSPTELMKLQADYARQAFDAMVQQTSRSTEASLKLAGEVTQPISNRVAIAADKMKVAA